MLRLIGIVISIGLADSINPSTIAPGLFFAAGPDPQRTVTRFTLGAFITYLISGLIIAFGPGELILSLVPKPDHNFRQILEVIVGAVLIAGAMLLWEFRSTLREKELPTPKAGGRSGFWLGVTVTVVEMPTAFPYLGALAAIIGSGENIGSKVGLIVLYNVCFILPMLGIIGILWRYGERAQDILGRARAFLQAHWPVLLAVVALVAGAITITLGATGIVARQRGAFGRLARRFRHILKLNP